MIYLKTQNYENCLTYLFLRLVVELVWESGVIVSDIFAHGYGDLFTLTMLT